MAEIERSGTRALEADPATLEWLRKVHATTKWTVSVCTGSIALLNEPYEGVCLSKCLVLPMDFLIWSGSCPSTHDCVPCTDPLSGGPTGAPGCENL